MAIVSAHHGEGRQALKLNAGSLAVLVTLTALLVLVAIFAGVVFGRKESTALEIGLLETITIAVTGLTGALYSYVFSRASVQTTASDVVRIHSRPAFRRVLHLYAGLQRLGASIGQRRLILENEADRENRVHLASVRSALDLLLAQVIE